MKDNFKILENLKKENPQSGFKVPDDYFESFEDSMLKRIEAEEKPFVKKVIMVIKPWLSLAAIFTLVAIVYYSIPYFSTEPKFADADLSGVSLEYLSSSYDELELIEIIAEKENQEVFESIQTNQDLLKDLSYEDIESIIIL